MRVEIIEKVALKLIESVRQTRVIFLSTTARIFVAFKLHFSDSDQLPSAFTVQIQFSTFSTMGGNSLFKVKENKNETTDVNNLKTEMTKDK